MSTKQNYPWADKEEQYRAYGPGELQYARLDAWHAARSMRYTAAEGWYMDDVCTIAKEMRRRGIAPLAYVVTTTEGTERLAAFVERGHAAEWILDQTGPVRSLRIQPVGEWIRTVA